MDLKIVKAALERRDLYEAIKRHVKDSTRPTASHFRFALREIEAFYSRDATAQRVDVDVLRATAALKIENNKKADEFGAFLDDAMAVDASAPNVAAFVLETRKYDVGLQLAVELAKRSKKADELVVEYTRLCDAEASLGSADAEVTVVDCATVDVAEFFAKREAGEGLMKVIPHDLGRMLRGGVRRGHHIIIFGPPNIGKSGTAISIICGFLKQGLTVLWVENEEPEADVRARVLTNLTDMTVEQIVADPATATERAFANGFGHFKIAHVPEGTPSQVDELCATYKPDILVINQIKNMAMGKSDSDVSRLEKSAQYGRRTTAKFNCATFSLTQGGDSCYGRPVLRMQDVYNSKTGIPGACDAMIGVGATEEDEANGYRTLSLPKNKIGNNHGHVVVRFISQLSKLKSIGKEAA